jgi:hypothetical protein
VLESDALDGSEVTRTESAVEEPNTAFEVSSFSLGVAIPLKLAIWQKILSKECYKLSELLVSRGEVGAIQR